MVGIQETNRAGTVTLSKGELAALRTYLARAGYRAGSRFLGVSRATVTTAALGGTMRPSTAVALRMGLSLAIQVERAMTDLILDAIRAAVRAELDAALDSRLSPLLAALKAAAPPARGLSPAEYAHQRGVSVWTVRRRIADGTLPHQRIGKRIVISADAVQSPEDTTGIERMAREARR